MPQNKPAPFPVRSPSLVLDYTPTSESYSIMRRCVCFLILLLAAALAVAQESSTQQTSSSPVPLSSVPDKPKERVPVPSPEDAVDDGEDELTERQTLSKDATLLCRTSPRGKNDPNVRGFAYSSNRCVALCRNGYGIPWRQTFTAQTNCGSGQVCVNRECIQAGTSKDLQTCTTIFNQSRRKYRQMGNYRVEAGVISACRLRCYNPNTGESLRVNRDDNEKCQNRLYEGTCRGGVCRSPNEAIAAIGSVIPIPYQEANAFANPEDHGIEVEEAGFAGEELALEENFGGRPQVHFAADLVTGSNDTVGAF